MQRKTAGGGGGGGKKRTNWRRCPLCQCDVKQPEGGQAKGPGGGKVASQDAIVRDKSINPMANPMVHICNCPTKIVHYRCQAQQMTASGRIHCNSCGAQYEGVRYQYRPKNFVEYLLSEGNARTGLIATASMLLSLFFTLVALVRTLFIDLELLVSELTQLQFSLSGQALKHDLKALMLINGRVVLPLLTVYLTASKVQAFIDDYFRWRLQHFAISVLEPEMLAEGGEDGEGTPRCHEGKSGGTLMEQQTGIAAYMPQLPKMPWQ